MLRGSRFYRSVAAGYYLWPNVISESGQGLGGLDRYPSLFPG